jgi:hypothetical protein
MRITALTSLLIFLLVGCATTSLHQGEANNTTEWRKGDFRVRFQAGPRGDDGRSYSFYDITHTAAGQQERSIVKESAHTLGGFGSVTNGDPKNWIRIVQDPNGRALLIEEEIPNDCGPCSNYLWVHLDTNGFIEGEYLRLPSKVTGPPGGIDYEFPKVRSLDSNVLRYDYSTGAGVTKRIDQIEKSDRPTPPG